MAAYRSLIYGLIIDYNGGGGLQDGRGASELLPLRKKSIFTSQGLVLLLLTNALTPYVPQSGDL